MSGGIVPRPGLEVEIDAGRGRLLHPGRPGHPEGGWFVLIGKKAYVRRLDEMRVDGQAFEEADDVDK